MRSLLRISVLALPLFTVVAFALDCPSEGRPQAVVGFSSDEFTSSESYLGVDTRDITPDRLAPLGLKEEHGVEVTTVDQDAPAGKAGVKEHDVILSVNGAQVESVEQLRRMIHEIPSGRVITLGLLRSGQPLTLKTQLADRKQSGGYEYAYGPDSKNFKFVMPEVHIPEIPEIHIPDIDIPVSVVVHSSLRSGLMIENLTPQLGDFFGVKNGQGVLVRSVEKGSRAEKAGFRAGDVIIKVNGQAVSDAGDFSHALRSRKDNSANLSVIRDRKEQTITLTLPEHWQSGGMYMNESLELPEIDSEARVAIEEATAEIAHLQPEIAKAAVNIKQVRPQLAKAAEDVRKNREELRKEMMELEKEMKVQASHSKRADI